MKGSTILLYSECGFWYPTMTLFRQTTPGDWAHVMDEVGSALMALAEAHARAK